jgi:hypothetical protein
LKYHVNFPFQGRRSGLQEIGGEKGRFVNVTPATSALVHQVRNNHKKLERMSPLEWYSNLRFRPRRVESMNEIVVGYPIVN